jgi:hypothetical protein
MDSCWECAGTNTIKERVVIFDEDSIPQLKKEYERRFQLHSEYGDYASALAMNTYINFLESIEEL